MPMTSTDVLSIIQHLEVPHLFVSADGGWGVDALLGEQTRPHDDLDLVVDFEEIDAVNEAMALLGFQPWINEMPTRFVLKSPGDRRIDFHPMHFDDTGYAHQQLPGGKLFTCRIDALHGAGRIADREVPCLTVELQLAVHIGYEPTATDQRDIQRLCDRFGLSPSEGYK